MDTTFKVRETVSRYAFEQAEWASGATAALEKVRKFINGRCERIAVTVSDNTGNRTATVTIVDENGATVFSKSGIAENASTTYVGVSHKSSPDADFNPFLCCGDLTATITPSGAPGTGGMTVDVVIYLR
jgi:hypothetical protein